MTACLLNSIYWKEFYIMATNKSVTNVTGLQGELRTNAKQIATALATERGAVKKHAMLLNEYFVTLYSDKRWFEANTQEKTPLADEIKIQRSLVVDTLKEKGHTNGRVVWQRIKQTAWELAFPAEAEAKEKAKAEAKEKAKAEAEGGTDNTVEVTGEMVEFAKLLAGSCDWDKSLANKVLALVFAEAVKADKKA